MSVAMMSAFRAGTLEGREGFKYTSELAAAFTALTIRDFLRVVPDQGEHIDPKVWEIILVWVGTLQDWDLNTDVVPDA